jgi:hypothetical protein
MIHSSRAALLGASLFLVSGLSSGFAEEPKAPSKPRILLGACSRDSLLQAPYSDWFTPRYEEYQPHSGIMDRLKALDADVDVTVFFGSWCGDSKRQVPRFLKVLDEMSFPMQRVELIAVSGADSVKKQSPQGQERGQEIYRVPTMLFKRDGREINRIVEYPVQSLERDLLRILSGQEYEPNYRSYPLLSRWLQDGLLSDENVSSRGLANQVRSLVSSEGELSAAGSVLMGRGQNPEAVKVLEMNVVLFPESANRRIALARALHAVGDGEEAEKALRRALELDEDHERQDDILKLLETVQISLQKQDESKQNEDR